MSETKTTRYTIEVSSVDEDFIMDAPRFIESTVLIGEASDEVEIIDCQEDLSSGPAKTKLFTEDGSPKVMYFGQMLKLGFVFADSTLSAGSKVIFNIGER
jgi:hypothetical protein